MIAPDANLNDVITVNIAKSSATVDELTAICLEGWGKCKGLILVKALTTHWPKNVLVLTHCSHTGWLTFYMMEARWKFFISKRRITHVTFQMGLIDFEEISPISGLNSGTVEVLLALIKLFQLDFSCIVYANWLWYNIHRFIFVAIVTEHDQQFVSNSLATSQFTMIESDEWMRFRYLDAKIFQGF